MIPFDEISIYKLYILYDTFPSDSLDENTSYSALEVGNV